ncbi:hypothetical protein A2943_01885 [Candidatus Adlerbacteria bacterium RIFCSPLOWO2_01_FULL_51_16]|uniref:Major facilitator superfamily (MFS) profile domain-containing protein n=1 Tax=Candidatus Adlerbacteria bacterium RIFCSPLOWO2_01_FULL_51_16 TaxID=1797243 RepID=A0A1F4XFH2_9BACT|nr:MAG: hypothetical protein A2943_01885 [Candidatus Adlerbacteria bacterium RIFCSPLOWO2_01_FULL_51_16]
MKTLLNVAGWAMFLFGMLAAVSFVLASSFVMLDPVVQEFLVAYGFQICMAAVILALFLGRVEERLPSEIFEVGRDALFQFFVGWVFLSISIFMLVFRDSWTSEVPLVWAAILLVAVTLLVVSRLMWKSAYPAKVSGSSS